MQYVHLSCRLLIAGTFLVSAGVKAHSRTVMTETVSFVRSLRLVAPRLARSTALLLVLAEALVVALLIPTRTVAFGLALAAVLLTTFAAGTLLALGRGVRVTCRCFGASRANLGVLHLVRDGALIAVAIIGLLTTQRQPSSVRDLASLALTLLVVAVALAAVVFLEEILYLLTPPARLTERNLHG